MAFWASSGVAHRDEAESAGTAGHAVHHQVGFDDRAVGGKGVLQMVFGDVEGKISNKYFIIHSVMFYCSDKVPCFQTVPDYRVLNHH